VFPARRFSAEVVLAILVRRELAFHRTRNLKNEQTANILREAPSYPDIAVPAKLGAFWHSQHEPI